MIVLFHEAAAAAAFTLATGISHIPHYQIFLIFGSQIPLGSIPLPIKDFQTFASSTLNNYPITFIFSTLVPTYCTLVLRPKGQRSRSHGQF
jgi:hypothetical protein